MEGEARLFVETFWVTIFFGCVAADWVGISLMLYEGNTCNMHSLKVSEAVREEVKEAGMVSSCFNTVGVSVQLKAVTHALCTHRDCCAMV
jgi:dihydroxyacid dehydratase/phosphogluconate dehydratase